MSLTSDQTLTVLVAWVLESSEATTVGEALRFLYTRDSLPEDIRAAWTSLHLLPLEDLRNPSAGLTISNALRALALAFKDERDAFVFWSRIPLAPPTLDDIAAGLGITRERVRQIQSRAEKKVTEALADSACSALRWRIWNFGERVGRIIPPEAPWYDTAAEEFVQDTPESWHPRLEELALWSIGPYRRDSLGWLSCGDPIEPDHILRHAVGIGGKVDLGLVRHNLLEAGIVPNAAGPWIDRYIPVKETAGGAFRWSGSVADKAVIVLAARGEPLSIEEIVEQIGEGHDPRGTRGRLISDPRFIRVGLRQIGLKGWNADEYTGITDEITEELERRGGSGPVREITTAIVGTHGVAPGSVVAMMGAPRFVVQDGYVRFRRPDEPYVVERTTTDERGCFLVGNEVCVWRIRIDDQLLRGSGRRVPVGLGAWLGVVPGTRVDYHLSDGGRVQVSWPDSVIQGPSVGSLRAPAQRLGGCEGDYLLIRFDRARRHVEVALVQADAADNGDSLTRLSTMTGIDASLPDFLDRLTTAVGATSQAELRERLRKRDEESLIELLPTQRQPDELDDALQQLRRLF